MWKILNFTLIVTFSSVFLLEIWILDYWKRGKQETECQLLSKNSRYLRVEEQPLEIKKFDLTKVEKQPLQIINFDRSKREISLTTKKVEEQQLPIIYFDRSKVQSQTKKVEEQQFRIIDFDRSKQIQEQPLQKINVPETKLNNAIQESRQPEKNKSINDISFERIVYSRLPNCASQAMVDLIKELSSLNKFQYEHGSENIEKRFVSDSKAHTYFKKIWRYQKSYIVSEELFFVNFTKLWFKPHGYITIIRDPVDRALSHYYHIINGGEKNIGIEQMKHKTLDECIRSSSPFCLNLMNVMLNYFCGQDNYCKIISEETMNKAKENVERYYHLVGLYEDIPEFIRMLEKMLPNFFANATTVYSKNEEEYIDKYATLGKKEPSEEIRNKLKDLFSHEYQFYEFIKQKFYNKKRQYDTDLLHMKSKD